MSGCPRLTSVVAKTFPTATPAQVQKHIQHYRARRDHYRKTGQPDWEGDLEFFRRVTKIAFQNRSKLQ